MFNYFRMAAKDTGVVFATTKAIRIRISCKSPKLFWKNAVLLCIHKSISPHEKAAPCWAAHQSADCKPVTTSQLPYQQYRILQIPLRPSNDPCQSLS